MKNIYIIAVLITMVNCNSQNKIKTSKTMKTFDIEGFKKNKTMNSYFFTSNDGISVKQYENEDEYWETIKSVDSVLEYFYEYFKNGKVKRFVKRFPKAFALGNLKEYDEQGTLIKEIDLDAPYTFSWEDIKKYLMDHDVEDIQKQVIGISRWSDANETTWTLDFNGRYKDVKGRFVIVLDGKTGEELIVKLFKGKDALGETGTIAVYDTIYVKK